MRSTLLPLIAASAWLASSCQSTPLPAPIALGAELTAEYRGGVTTESWVHETLGTKRPDVDEFDETSPLHQLTLTVYTVDRDTARHLLTQAAGGLRAHKVDGPHVRERMQGLAAADPASIGHRSGMTVYEGQRGLFAVVNQTAFIEKFEFQSNADAFIADPNVGVAQEGLVMTVEARTPTVEFELVRSRLQRPISSVSVLDHHTGTHDLEVEVPIYVHDVVTAKVDLQDARDGVLISGIPSDSPQHVSLALLQRWNAPRDR